MYRNLRTFSTISRSLFRQRVTIPPQDGHIEVRHVRFLRPFFTLKRARKALLWTTVISATWYLLDDDDDFEDEAKVVPEQNKRANEATKTVALMAKAAAVEEERKELDNKGSGESEDNEDEDITVPTEIPENAIFIPLTRARKLPPTFYKGSDPEWQSFVEFSKDRKRGEAVRRELAGIIGGWAANQRGIAKVLGQPVQVGRVWLDTEYPSGPGPEYERTGLEIADEYVALTVRPVDAITLSRVNRALFPTSVAESFWEYHKTLWKLQMAKAKGYFAGDVPTALNERRLPPGYANLPSLEDNEDDTKSPETPSPKTTVEGTKSSKATLPTPSSPTDVDSEQNWVLRNLPPLPTFGSDFNVAAKTFRRTLGQKWKPASAPIPRGAFLLSGLIDVHGPEGICTVDIRAAYHPVASEWVGFSIDIRSLRRKKQSPKGGA